MTRKKWFLKLFVIIFVILVSIYCILPTFGKKTLKISFWDNVSQEEIASIKDDFPTENFILTEEDGVLFVKGYDLNVAKMNEIRSYSDIVKDAELQKHWAEGWFAKKVNLGLDLQGGMQVVMRADFEDMARLRHEELSDEDKKAVTQQARIKLESRINEFGVSEPLIRMRGDDVIEVQLPGVSNPDQVKETIKKTGRVEYRLVDDQSTNAVLTWLAQTGQKIPVAKRESEKLLAEIKANVRLASNVTPLYLYSRDKETNDLYPSDLLVLSNDIALAGSDIKSASVNRDETGQPVVGFKTTVDGAEKFAYVTRKENEGKRMAIVIDDQIRSAPRINTPITNGSAQIEGDFTLDEADMLQKIIMEGALPVSLVIEEERTVGPTLGQDSIDSGVKAIAIGFLIVAIFMIVYYKIAGIVADFCLFLNMLMMLALLSMMNFTLTLPGMAGFILTVGMAVDANVIIYERIKEELRSGKSVRTAVENGYGRAFWTIFDANVTTLIAGFVLSQLGTGPIKGFAVTLIIGIICSMFTSLYVSKFIYMTAVRNNKIKKLHL